MTTHLVSATGTNQCYFNRSPEHLVLEGYRHWSAGYETGSIQPWEMALDIYTATLGDPSGRRAMSELSNYVRTLKKCAQCPLRAFPFHSHHLCTEECLTLGLIAGLQHGDDTADLCLEYLACPQTNGDLAEAAFLFATTLRELDQVLLPIPSNVITDVMTRQSPHKYH